MGLDPVTSTIFGNFIGDKAGVDPQITNAVTGAEFAGPALDTATGLPIMSMAGNLIGAGASGELGGTEQGDPKDNPLLDPRIIGAGITGLAGLGGALINKDNNKAPKPKYSYSPFAQALFPKAMAIVDAFLAEKGIKVPEPIENAVKEEAVKVETAQAQAAVQAQAQQAAARKPSYFSHDPETPFRPANYQPAANKAAPMPEPAQGMPKPATPPEPPKFSNPVYASQVANPTNEAAMNEYARRAAPTPPPPRQPTPISSYDEENQRRQAAMKMLLSQIYGGGPRL